jgi:signal transduction histidine kinase
MSIRLRLTLLYSTILALTLIAFSVTLYGVQARYTMNAHRHELSLQAQRLSIGLGRTLAEGVRRVPLPGGPRPGTEGRQELRDLRIRDRISFMDLKGNLLDHPVNLTDESVTPSPESLQAVRTGQPWIEIVNLKDERLLVYSSPVRVDGAVVGFVQLARSLADRDRSLRALGIALTVGSLLITLAAFGIGWVLSGYTLRPIDRITQSAREIGSERDLSRRVPYKGPNDEVGQLAATLNNMLGELQDAYQQIEQALDLQRSFVADVSHELRTPLTTLRGNLSLLGRRPPLPDKEQKDILADMVGENERLIRLVSDLLALARAQAGPLLQSERVPLPGLIEDVCRQARLLDPERELVCSDLEPEAVLADPSALKQVLLVLLDNAILHGEGTVRVTVHQSPLASQISVSVRDEGPGIAPDILARLFERFYRGKTASQKPGLGLGLPIAKALVEAQNGTLSVESQEKVGSTFIVSLPAA